MTDTLKRDDINPNPDLVTFSRLSEASQAILTRAASSANRAVVSLPSEAFSDISEQVNVPGWLMVPDRKGALRQVVAHSDGKAFRY